MKQLIQNLLDRFGYTLQKKREPGSDMTEPEFLDLYQLCMPYTMTSRERMYSLYMAVDYVLKHDVPGDFVECGVWRGGSAMLIARMLHHRGIQNRRLYLYDTYEGMSSPTAADRDFAGRDADALLNASEHNKETSVWCLADIADVKNNMAKTNLPGDLIHFIKGKVEDTLPMQMPQENIAILRLDTDWYASTLHELHHLYPRLSVNGVLIIDDYGHWEGCRKAVDEYFQEKNIQMLLNRIDYTGRLGIKTQSA